MSETTMPNQDGVNGGQGVDYLKRAADACEQGDTVLGMHLYLAAYEKAAADPNIPDGMALAGLREAWHLACELKERSMAEYVFEKLEPYLTGEEIAACAGKLQSLALDRLEQYGFSREDLEEMAEMISADFMGGETSVVKVESISIPNAGMFGVPDMIDVPSVPSVPSGPDTSDAPAMADMPDNLGVQSESLPERQSEPESDEAKSKAGSDRETMKPGQIGMGVADVNDFNPYDMYRDYSIGKSYHCATNEGSGAAVFTRDEERAAAHERFLAGETESVISKEPADKHAQEQGGLEPTQVAPALVGQGKAEASASGQNAIQTPSGDAAKAIAPTVPKVPSAPSASDIPAMPDVPRVDPGPFNYRALSGYDEAIAVMRDYGVGLQNDQGFKDFLSMLNERHGLDRAPSLDSVLFRAPVLEDASRFAEATIGEIGLPSLRMSMEEGIQGMPVLCIIAQGNHRPRMNHAHNRFEAPAILVLDDLDTWVIPQAPEGIEGMAGLMMANISRGAREAMNLIRSAVEDPDVYVLATATTDGQIDPFFYEVLEPLTIVDIGNPDDGERADIWAEIARNHPSMRTISRSDLVRHSRGLARFDIYMAARDAIEDAYKQGIVQRSYVPVTQQNILEKLAACYPLDSDEYRLLEEAIVECFQKDLDRLDDLIDTSQG